MHVTVSGKRWELVFCRLPKGVDGECDPPDKPRKQIRINKRLRGEERLNTIIHELTHAAGWHIDEAFIEQFGTDAARVLTKLGYREGDA